MNSLFSSGDIESSIESPMVSFQPRIMLVIRGCWNGLVCMIMWLRLVLHDAECSPEGHAIRKRHSNSQLDYSSECKVHVVALTICPARPLVLLNRSHATLRLAVTLTVRTSRIGEAIGFDSRLEPSMLILVPFCSRPTLTAALRGVPIGPRISSSTTTLNSTIRPVLPGA